MKALTHLVSLDLSMNEVCNIDGYREKVFEMIPSLEVLDGKNKAGESVDGSEDDYGDYGEEGEAEQEMLQEILNNLDPETRKRFEAGEISKDEVIALGLGDADDYGEEGEDEVSEEEGGSKL